MTKEEMVEKLRHIFKQKESSGDYTAYNEDGGAYGAYQFQQPTWDALAKKAGYGSYVGTDIRQAPPEVQDNIARQHLGDLYDATHGNPYYIANGHYAGLTAALKHQKEGRLPTASENGYPSQAEYSASIVKMLGADYSVNAPSKATDFNPMQTLALQGMTPDGTPLGVYEQPDIVKPAPLNFWEGMEAGFESSSFGQWITHQQMEVAKGVWGTSTSEWTPSDSDFDYVDTTLKGLPDLGETKYRIMTTAKSREHMMELINYEQERRKREERASATPLLTAGGAGNFIGSLLNPVNLIPMVGVSGRVVNLAKAGFARTLIKASAIGAQNAVLNVADEYGAHKIGGTHFNPKEAALIGFVAGTGMETLAHYVGRGYRYIDDLYFKTKGMQERAAAQIVGNVKVDGFTETDFAKVLKDVDAEGMTSAAATELHLPSKSIKVQKAEELLRQGHNRSIKAEDGTLAATMVNEGKLKIVTLDAAKKMGRRMGFSVDDKTNGFYLPNSDIVVAVRENIKDTNDLEKIVYHEYGVHHAKEVMDERTWDTLMDYTKGRMKNPKGQWLDAVKRARSNDPEEVLAHFIELGGKLKDDHKLGKVIRGAKQGLRHMGIVGLDDDSITAMIKDITWKEAEKKRGYTVDPDGAAVIGTARFSVDNPIHPHNYAEYINTVDEINASHNQSALTRLIKINKYFGSDFGKTAETPSKTLEQMAADCFRDPYQSGRNNEYNLEHIREMQLGKYQVYDEGMQRLRSKWMERADVLKRISLEGHDNLVNEFDKQVFLNYDNAHGALGVRKEMRADPEVMEAVKLMHAKRQIIIDELQHSATYLGLKDMPNILSKDFKVFDDAAHRRIDAIKHSDFINHPSFGGDETVAKKWLKKYGVAMACRKLEANRKRLASKLKKQPDEISDAQLMDWIDKQAGKWALGVYDQDASRPEHWLDEGGSVHPDANINPLDFLNDRFIGDSSVEMALPDGSMFSFDNNLRDFSLDRINAWQTSRTAGEIAFRSKFKNDEEFAKVFKQIEKELNYAMQGVRGAKGMTKLSRGERNDILTTAAVMFSKLRGKPLNEAVTKLGNSWENDVVGILAKATYPVAGNNIGVSSLAEVIQSVASSGGEIIPRLAEYVTKGTTMNDLKELVELNHLQDMNVRMGGRPLNTEDLARKYGDTWSMRFFDKTVAGLNAFGRFTNLLNQLPRLTETWTNLMKASAMQDLIKFAHNKEIKAIRKGKNPQTAILAADEQYLKEAGVTTPELHEALMSDLRKYFPDGKVDPNIYLTWRKESPRTFLQFTKFAEDSAIRGMTRQTIGNVNTTLKSKAFGQLASFFMTFTQMATHSQTLRLLNRPTQDIVLNVAFSMIGGLASYSAYTAVMAETKYAFDEKKKREYYAKKFNPQMYITAALTRGAALSPLAYVQNGAEIFGVSPATVRTTVGGNNNKIKDGGDLVGNVVNQMPIINTVFNMGASVKNLGELAAYKATNGKYGSSFSQAELGTLSQAIPTGNFFATQLGFEALKKELNLPKKERKAKGGN